MISLFVCTLSTRKNMDLSEKSSFSWFLAPKTSIWAIFLDFSSNSHFFLAEGASEKSKIKNPLHKPFNTTHRRPRKQKMLVPTHAEVIFIGSGKFDDFENFRIFGSPEHNPQSGPNWREGEHFSNVLPPSSSTPGKLLGRLRGVISPQAP